MHGVNGCEAWFDVRESARRDSEALWYERLDCESEPADGRRGRRVRAACCHELCEHAREHIVRFAAVPDIAERRKDAEAICRQATMFGSSTRKRPASSKSG